MADDVSALEAEVEGARQRLARTLDKLADPATHEAMKDEVVARVTGYKDRLIGGARGTGQSYADDLKARAMNNPAAVALIGAGIAYRLYRHPPVTTLLVGAGVALLARARGRTSTDPTAYRAPYDSDQPRGYVPGGVAGYGYPVEEDAPGQTTTDRMVAAASQAGERAREMAEEAGSRISETAEQVRSAAQDTYEHARATAQDAYGRTAAGAGDAYDRASEMFETVRRNPLALGLLGIAAGALAGRALRSTDTGDRFVGAAGDVLGRGARGIGSGARYAASRTTDAASGLASAVSSAAGGVASTVSSAASDAASSVTAATAGAVDTVGGLASSVADRGSDSGDDGPPARGGRGSRGRNRSSGGRGRTRTRREPDDADEGFMTSAAEAASAAYRGAAGQADYARRRTADLAGQVADQVSDLGRNYPLLLGAIGIAAGAAVGLAMRPTESEDDLIGPYSDSLKARAREAFAEQYHEAIGAAEDLAEAFSERGGASGQSPGSAPAADWETVIGGGAPPAQSRTAGAGGAGAGSEVGPRGR